MCAHAHVAWSVANVRFSQTIIVYKVMVKGKVKTEVKRWLQVKTLGESLPISALHPLSCKAMLSCKILHKVNGLRSESLGQGLACGRDSVGP